MPLDAVAIAAIRHELEGKILQARFERIAQPSRGDLLFFLRRGMSQYRLFFAAETPCPWLGLVDKAPSNPSHPPAFCMLLRKHMLGGRLARLEQPSYERQLSLAVEHYDESAGLAVRTLHFELMGRRGNAILVDSTGMVLGSLLRTSHDGRGLLEPGSAYQPPATGRVGPDRLSEETLGDLLARAPTDATLLEFLQQRLLGLSAATLGGLIARAGLEPTRQPGNLSREAVHLLWATLSALIAAGNAADFSPQIVRDENGRPVDVLAFPGHLPRGYSQEPTPSLAESTGRIFGAAALDRSLERRRSSLLAPARAQSARARRKLEKQRGELAAAEQSGLHRTRGELILAHLAEMPRGAVEVELPSLTDPTLTTKIPLDPSLSASANAQVHFRRYRRAKRGQAAIAAQLVKTEEELAYLDELLSALALAETEAELAEIAAEMISEKLLPTGKEPAVKRAGPRVYRSCDGWQILVGRNNRQNDYLTFSLARPDDTWLHTRQIPGAHVVIRPHGTRELPPATLLDAANLAVYHSQGRHGSKVPVDYTTRRHVRRRPGGRPGMVNYDHFQTLIVDPAPEVLVRLLGAHPGDRLGPYV